MLLLFLFYFYNFTAERLKNFTVAAGKNFDANDLDSFNPESYTSCLHHPSQVGTSETKELMCDRPVIGRYVTVYVYYSDGTTAQPLTICELQIFGDAVPGIFVQISGDTKAISRKCICSSKIIYFS